MSDGRRRDTERDHLSRVSKSIVFAKGNGRPSERGGINAAAGCNDIRRVDAE